MWMYSTHTHKFVRARVRQTKQSKVQRSVYIVKKNPQKEGSEQHEGE